MLSNISYVLSAERSFAPVAKTCHLVSHKYSTALFASPLSIALPFCGNDVRSFRLSARTSALTLIELVVLAVAKHGALTIAIASLLFPKVIAVLYRIKLDTITPYPTANGTLVALIQVVVSVFFSAGARTGIARGRPFMTALPAADKHFGIATAMALILSGLKGMVQILVVDPLFSGTFTA